MPYDIMKKIGTNVTIGSNIEFKNKVVFGDSILVYRKYRDPKTRKIVKEEVLPYEQPEIFEFLEKNNFNFVRMELANDLVIFYDGYLEYIFNNDNKSPKLVQIKAKESTCSRISEIDEKTGKSEWHGYSAEWHTGTPTDFNVEIQFNNRSGKEYKYRATFRTETLSQILDYLARSADLKWKIEEPQQQADDTLSKTKIRVDLY